MVGGVIIGLFVVANDVAVAIAVTVSITDSRGRVDRLSNLGGTSGLDHFSFPDSVRDRVPFNRLRVLDALGVLGGLGVADALVGAGGDLVVVVALIGTESVMVSHGLL